MPSSLEGPIPFALNHTLYWTNCYNLLFSKKQCGEVTINQVFLLVQFINLGYLMKLLPSLCLRGGKFSLLKSHVHILHLSHIPSDRYGWREERDTSSLFTNKKEAASEGILLKEVKQGPSILHRASSAVHFLHQGGMKPWSFPISSQLEVEPASSPTVHMRVFHRYNYQTSQ